MKVPSKSYKELIMKMQKKIVLALTAALLVTTVAPNLEAAAAAAPSKGMKVGVINFKECVERSKLGQQEQASFEALKKQAEQVLQEKEKEMGNIAAKLEDADYLDSLTPEAEAELKHKFRMLNQELSQQQQQLYQTLSQANYKVVQKLTDIVNNAAEEVAKNMKLDLVLNEDACFYFNESLNITSDTVKVMDDSALSKKK